MYCVAVRFMIKYYSVLNVADVSAERFYIMAFSEFLNSKRKECKELINELSENFRYVSILGSDVRSV